MMKKIHFSRVSFKPTVERHTGPQGSKLELLLNNPKHRQAQSDASTGGYLYM